MPGPLETNGVAETIDVVVVAVPVEDAVVELGLLVASVSGPVVEGEASSTAVVETSDVELKIAALVVGEASCRAIGRTTPAKATLRHKSNAKRAHSRPDTAVSLIFAPRGWTSAMMSHH